MNFLELAFWISAGLVFYTLAGYPLLSLLMALIVRKQVDKQPIEPTVSLIIAAYNEEEAIGRKIEQSLALDYPRDKLEIIVTSDGSTDRTDAIVTSYADRGVILHRVEGRKGKTGALNETVEIATGDILVFSDATGEYNTTCIRELVANFNDPTVGCATGRVTYRYGEDTTSRGFQGYQRFAIAIRRAESDWGSQTSVSGSIHAMRRSLYRFSQPPFSNDVIDAVHTVAQGFRVLYENNAISLEQSRETMRSEFRCRVRIGVRAGTMIPYIVSQLLQSRRYGYLFQMISHKFLRWWLWAFLLVLLVSSFLLCRTAPIYTVAAAVQAVGYSVGLLGIVVRPAGISLPAVSTVAFFVMANAAMCLGTCSSLRGLRMTRWEPVR